MELSVELNLAYRGEMPDLLCCDATLRQLPSGRWLCVFLTGGPSEPLPENRVVGIWSEDRGRTWSAPKTLFGAEEGATVPTEVSVLGDRLACFFSRHDGRFDHRWDSLVAWSDDEGESWSAPTAVEPVRQRTFVRNLYVKRDGTLVWPFQHHASGPDCGNPVNGVLLSRDGGASLTRHGAIEFCERGWTENNVVELSDGSLAMLIRADGRGCLYRADSPDGGLTWGPARPTTIPNPGAKFRLHRLAGGAVLLVHNPSATDRWPLAVWRSDDDLRHWSHREDVVTFPGRLQYPDGFVDEDRGELCFAFDYNRHDVIVATVFLPSSWR